VSNQQQINEGWKPLLQYIYDGGNSLHLSLKNLYPSMQRYLILILFVSLVSWMSCNSADPDVGTGLKLEIAYEAGEMPEEWNFLPYPAHYGVIQGHHVFLLTKAQNPGSSRSINPIATMHTRDGGKEVKWLIANDAHDQSQWYQIHTGEMDYQQKWYRPSYVDGMERCS